MVEMKVGRVSTAISQLEFVKLQALSEAVLNGRFATRHRPVGMAPQYVPAGLGVDAPARATANVSGASLVERLRAARNAALVTGRERDYGRVVLWESRLRGDGEQSELVDDPPTLRDLIRALRSEREELSVWFRSQSSGEEELMAEVHLAEGEADGLRAEGGEKFIEALEAADQARARYAEFMKARCRYQQAEDEIYRLQAILAATSKRGQKSSTRRPPHDPVYLVKFPRTVIAVEGGEVTVRGQRLLVDLNASASHLLEVLGTSRSPVIAGRDGTLRRNPAVSAATWAAWVALTREVHPEVIGTGVLEALGPSGDGLAILDLAAELK